MTQFLYDLNTTDASNTDIDGADIAENNAPATINNALRALCGSIARTLHAQTGEKITAGTADAQTLTTGLGWAALENAWISFEAGAGLTNTGACTIDVDTLGAVAIKVAGGADPWAGAITAGGIYLLFYDSGASVWQLLNPWIDRTVLAAKSQDDQAWYGLLRGTVADGDYLIVINARRAGTIGQTTTKCVSGTATATFKVNTTALGGVANAVSSSEVTETHASANTFAIGDDIVIAISAASSCIGMSFSIEFTESLD
jgi:hypothetical protein